MKHSICGFNHAALILNYKLNYDDAQVLDCIVKFRDTGKMDTISVDGKQYFWVCYSWLLDELPGLQCSNKRTLARWMDKYVENGLMEKHILSGNRTYYRFIPEALNNLQSYPVLQSTSLVSKIVTPVLQSTTPCTPEYNPPVLQSTTIDPSSNNPSTNKSGYIVDSSESGEEVSSLNENSDVTQTSSLKPKKEESSGKEERKLTSEEKLFNFWISYKNLVQHKAMTKTMQKVLNARLKEESLERLFDCVINYHTVLTGENYFYSYPHNIDDFFRNGSVQKVSPYRNFLPESKPLEKFLKNKINYNQNTQEEDTYKDPPQVETLPDENKALSLVLRVIKELKGEETAKYIAYARSSDIEKLRQAYYLAKDKKYQECYNFMISNVTLSFEDYKIEWDKRMSGGW